MNGKMNGTKGLGAGFLSFNKSPPRIYITAEDEVFDATTLQHWRDEGMAHAFVMRIRSGTMADGCRIRCHVLNFNNLLLDRN
jgi:hypothetical protein